MCDNFNGEIFNVEKQPRLKASPGAHCTTCFG